MKHRARSGLLMLILPIASAICLSNCAMAMRVGEPGAGIHGARASASARVTQGYLGVDIRDVSQAQMKALKLNDRRGAEIIHVDHDGPAGKLGLCPHDVILQMNGQQIVNQEQLRRMLRETPAGRTIKLVISRDGRQQTVTTELADRQEVERRAWEQHLVVPDPGQVSGQDSATNSGPENAPPPHMGNGFLRSNSLSGLGARAHRDILGPTTVLSASFTGAQLEVMGPQLADFFGVEGNAGLLVRSVEVNSPAADAGLRAGDVVIRINQIAVTTGNEWSKTIHQNRGKSVDLVVVRDKHEQTMTMTPDNKKRSSVEWPLIGKDCLQVAEL